MANVIIRERLTQRSLLQNVVWTEGQDRSPRPNPTPGTIASLHAPHLRKLFLANKAAGSDPRLAKSINQMRQCRDSQPCGKGACPSCEAYAQRAVACGLTTPFAAVKKGQLPLTALTVIPRDGQCARDALASDQAGGGVAAYHSMRRKLHAALRNADIKTVIAGLDITLNLDRRTGAEPFPDHWQQHLNLIVRTSDLNRLLPLLKAAFPPSDTISRPIVKRRLNGNLVAAGYLFKRLTDPLANNCRLTIPPNKRQPAGACNTRLKSLTKEDWLMLLRFLDRLGIGDRLIVSGPWQKPLGAAGRVDPIFPMPLPAKAKLRSKQGPSPKPNY